MAIIIYLNCRFAFIYFFLDVVMDVSEVEIAKTIKIVGLKLCKFLLLQACTMHVQTLPPFSTIFHLKSFSFNKFLGVICTFEVVYTKPSGDLDMMCGFCQIFGASRLSSFGMNFGRTFV